MAWLVPRAHGTPTMQRGWSLMIFCARATRGLRGMGEERPGASLLAERAIKMCSLDARSRGQPWPLL